MELSERQSKNMEKPPESYVNTVSGSMFKTTRKPTNKDGKCYRCGLTGHFGSVCC
ncbi:hypothetical protein DPMN_158682 [Dreissena polymorpha]|uniref:CCHC-type domain-containing protein n=1 Tax=Dreissena polymorpha TaxID=45954 RepID=A0A9D4IR30_DREPO|nr:hypothetical protein DPMN_158682 [Dreissena polymorpha]